MSFADGMPMEPATEQLELLYKEIRPGLLAYFRRRPTLAGTAEDLLQDTFVRALRHPERLASSVSPRAYLFGIARHVSLDTLRRSHPTEALAGTETMSAESDDARLEPMREAIAALPEAQRDALLLKLHHELSYAEIAEVLGIPVGTVRSRLHHAVLALRATLQPPTQHSP
jgi:RNA polymerase sigma-70 factor (ECF subfamily)